MRTYADFVFTVNVRMQVSDTATVDDASARIEDAIWEDLPDADFDIESLYVVGRLA
jgi:hypothetical protein